MSKKFDIPATLIDLENGDRFEIQHTSDHDPLSDEMCSNGDKIHLTLIRRGRRIVLTKTLDGLRNLIEGLVNDIMQPMDWGHHIGKNRPVRAEEVDAALGLYVHTISAQRTCREAFVKFGEDEDEDEGE